MKKQITSQVLGRLTQDDNYEEWWHIDNVKIPFFDNESLSITFMDFNPETDRSIINEVDEALRSFMKMGYTERLKISDLVFKNFNTIKQEVDEPYWSDSLQDLSDSTLIWNFIQPTGITLARRHRRDCNVYVNVSCRCEWDEEHGLQLVFKQGKKITRVSEIDGHLTDADAYDIPDEEDELLSKFDSQ